MKIIDSHCHYNLDPLYKNWQKHLEKAKKSGVIASIVVGANENSSKTALDLARQEKSLYAAVGIHPLECKNTQVFDSFRNVENMAMNPDVVAIGETGLDYFRDEDRLEQVVIKQKELFKLHIDLAKKLNKTLIIHVRDKEEQAYYDTLDILKKANTKRLRFILHCISGPKKYVVEAIKMGAYIGSAGNMTYKSASNLRELLLLVPNNRILIETDAPYLAPNKYRGHRCEPYMITETYKYLNEKLEIKWQQLLINTEKIFQIGRRSYFLFGRQ